jgi:hypothetical protein
MATDAVVREDLSSEVKAVLQRLVGYCCANDWSGYDPYDALNSRVLEKLPFVDSRPFRIAVTQFLKRSPVNLRPVLAVAKTQNPKALGLFLSAFSQLAAAGIKDYAHHCEQLTERLEALRSPNESYWCWGYSFPWQTRTVIVPSGQPNLVCTAFVADALLHAYEHCRRPRYLAMATSAAEYIIDKLYWSDSCSIAGFAYPLSTVHNQVHNANLLAGALLCRISRHTGERRFLTPALKAVRYSVSRQAEDGSWRYGEGRSQGFVDNFHTGFNICALYTIMCELRSDEFKDNVKRGFQYYYKHFYLKDGSVRYFHNKTYPIDIHAVAQSIITPVVLHDLSPSLIELAASVFRWSITHMWDPRGYFYYRVLRSGTIRIPYMRWSEAWMVFAIAQLLCTLSQESTNPGTSILENCT